MCLWTRGGASRRPDDVACGNANTRRSGEAIGYSSVSIGQLLRERVEAPRIGHDDVERDWLTMRGLHGRSSHRAPHRGVRYRPARRVAVTVPVWWIGPTHHLARRGVTRSGMGNN